MIPGGERGLQLLVVGCGGFFGAVARFSLSGYVNRRLGDGFPGGTLCVNVLGCFLIGALMVFVAQRASLSPEIRLFLSIGFLGSLTTFSTFGMESVGMLRAGDLRSMALNVALNVVLGLLAVLAGGYLMRLLTSGQS